MFINTQQQKKKKKKLLQSDKNQDNFRFLFHDTKGSKAHIIFTKPWMSKKIKAVSNPVEAKVSR